MMLRLRCSADISLCQWPKTLKCRLKHTLSYTSPIQKVFAAPQNSFWNSFVMCLEASTLVVSEFPALPALLAFER